EQVPLEAMCFAPQLPEGLKERDSLQYKGNSQHGVGEQVVTAAGLLAADELADTMPDRHRRTDDEQTDRGEQRPHVCLAAIAEGAARIGGPGAAPIGDHQ